LGDYEDCLVTKRVVVTGYGLVTPLGVGVEETWESLCAGKSGVTPITLFNASGLRSQIAAEVKNFNPEDFLDKKSVRRLDRFIHFAIAAARMAVESARLEIPGNTPERVGAYIGTGLGGLQSIEYYHEILLSKGPSKVSPFFIPMLIGNMAPGQISILFGAKGPNLSISTACAAGSHAIGESYKLLQSGMADVMICGGSEAVITPLAISGFNAMRALSERNDDPPGASRPFEKNRDGFVVGEGSGIMVLETLEHALARNAHIRAELIGYGLSSDAYHMTAPAPEGEGAARCMKCAIDSAGIRPDQVDYINAHGTSTDLNDKSEFQAIQNVFGDHVARMPVSSTKSMTGHLLGAAGGIEAIFCVLTIERDIIPPTINYMEPDPEILLDVVPHQARAARIDVAMSNSFGFGGTNGCLVFKRWYG